MHPGQIKPDPAQPDAHIVMRAPPGTEDWCGDLHTRIAINSAGQVGFMSEWIPTDEERARITAGFPVRTFIVGRSLPPQSVWVPKEGEV